MTTKQLIADTLPSGWKIGKLKYFYKFETGFTPPTTRPEYYTPDGEMWVTIADMCNSEVTSSKNRISKLYADSIKAKKVPRGSLLYSFKLSLGKTSIAGCDTYTNEAIASFSSEKNPCINFLKYSSCMIEDNALENIYGAKLLNRERIENAIIVFPPIKTQERIAEYLGKRCSRIDECIKKLQAQLQLVSSYRQSLITRAVTKGLDPNVEMKDSGVEWIGSIPREWKTSKISFVSDVTLGKMLCPRQTDSEQTLETYLCAGSISWDGVKDYIKEMWFSSKEKSELLLIAGDVLVVEGGAGFGMTTLYKGEHSPCYFQNSIIRVRGHHNVMTSDFINYWMRFTYTAYLKTVCNEATFSHYTKEKVSETPILVPPLNEQKKIADFCKLVDERVKTICAGIENQISKLNEYRSSLISAAVTGQLAIDEEASA